MIPKNNEVRFETTTACNYNCLICPRKKLIRSIQIMSLDMFKTLLDKVLNETDQYKILTFCGFGEPLLDPTLLDKIKYAHEKKLEVLMLTNGYFLNINKFKELEQAGVKSIRVSIYGNTRKIYNEIHIPPDKLSFDKIYENLTKICKIKKTTEIILTYNIIRGINSNYSGWVKYWKNKADLLEVWYPHNWVDACKYRKVQNKKLNTCNRPFKTPLQIQVDGTVNMCCLDFNGQLTFGDLKKQTLKEIFESNFYQTIIKCHTTGDFKNSGLICENCDQRNKLKNDVMAYNSKYTIADRVKKVSTNYSVMI